MHKLSYKNLEIIYTDTGKGTAVVLLHGFLENQKMWSCIFSNFSAKYRIITLDLLGHGSTGCLGYVHTMEDNARMLRAVILHLGIRKAIFVGHSMGGYVALAYAELFPQNMKALVLLNSTAKEDSEDRKQNRIRAVNAVKSNHTTFIRLSIANLFSEENRNNLNQELNNVVQEALQTPLQGIIASLEGMKIRKDRVNLIHDSKFPVLLVLGKKDPVLNYNDTIEQIKNSKIQLETLPDGHMSHIENKEALKTILLHFFKSV